MGFIPPTRMPPPGLREGEAGAGVLNLRIRDHHIRDLRILDLRIELLRIEDHQIDELRKDRNYRHHPR